MRQVGVLANESDAHRFAAFLVTQGVAAHAERDDDDWAIWVRDENDIERARHSFEKFRLDPTDARYRGAEQAAGAMRRAELRQRAEAQKNVIEMHGRWRQPGTARRGPLAMTLLALSVIVAVSSNFGDPKTEFGNSVVRQLLFCDLAAFAEQPNPLASVATGEVWRVVTPIFVHFGVTHLVFNMIWLVLLGGQIETIRGTGRFALLVLLVAVASNSSQALAPADLGGTIAFGGMSGVVYGLFGFIWMRSVFDSGAGFFISQFTVIILIGWLFLCMTGRMGNIANVAHVVGLITGMAAGYLPILFRR